MDKQKRKIIKKKGKFFSETERNSILMEMLKNNWTKQYTWELYTGMPEEHGQILRWMRKLGYVDGISHKKFNFTGKSTRMSKKVDSKEFESFEVLQLKKRILELEKQLHDAEMKAVAYSTMVDMAEKEFNIPIKKKFNTKPSL